MPPTARRNKGADIPSPAIRRQVAPIYRRTMHLFQRYDRPAVLPVWLAAVDLDEPRARSDQLALIRLAPRESALRLVRLLARVMGPRDDVDRLRLRAIRFANTVRQPGVRVGRQLRRDDSDVDRLRRRLRGQSVAPAIDTRCVRHSIGGEQRKRGRKGPLFHNVGCRAYYLKEITARRLASTLPSRSTIGSAAPTAFTVMFLPPAPFSSSAIILPRFSASCLL